MNEDNYNYNSKEAAADRLATASFVLGIISLVSVFCCCPFVFSAIGIILALLSKGASEHLRPRAKTGLILSVIGILVSIVVGIMTVAFPIMMLKTNPEYKKNILKTYEESLEMNEQLIKDTYGEDVYNQMEEMIDDIRNW